jgi:hypothetical protein
MEVTMRAEGERESPALEEDEELAVSIVGVDRRDYVFFLAVS